MLRLLTAFSLPELYHHPWRNLAAVFAVMLGVALAFSVHLINASALGEFSSALRAASGEPDLELRATQGGFDERVFARVAAHPAVVVASPVLELQTTGLTSSGQRRPLRLLGIDALTIVGIAPALLPRLADGAPRLAMLTPGVVFLNNQAEREFGTDTLSMQSGLRFVQARVQGSVAAPGPALAVMDIAAAQDLFGRGGELTRIDLRLAAGASAARVLRELELPPDVQAAGPDATMRRVDHLSRAYRVNLTVLALVALFTGSFLVFSVLALGVARRAPQFALLGVLGATANQRRRLVLAEALALGAVGSVAGIALGTALSAVALRMLGGDLGGGYFPGVAPGLQWSTPAALVHGMLGIAAAVAGAWRPARGAAALPIAQTLKGLGARLAPGRAHWNGIVLVMAAGALALVPPVFGLPLAAYASIGLLLMGGIIGLPTLVGVVYDRLAPRVAHRILALLAVERARRVRESAAVAVSGVVAALSLSVALTVMVTSFRESMTQWLDVLLPADLYVRAAANAQAAETTFFTPAFAAAVAAIPGVARVSTQRLRALQLAADLPAVTLLSREIGDASRSLPLVAGPVAVPAGDVAVYVSEAVVDLHGARLGQALPVLARAFALPSGQRFVVAGIWRDYARQTGAIAMDRADYERLTGDTRANELHVWFAQNAQAQQVQSAVRSLGAAEAGAAGPDIASASQLRAISMRIFDRSFAVTYWLQAVAIGIGLFGVAASFSAQVLARRKEFGLLAHLGFTRRQVLAVVAGEGAAWTLIGSIAGVALGLLVAVVLVHIVNPQSFHWTMDMAVPWLRLLALGGAVIVAGTLAAWLSGRAAGGRDAVLAVKEDW